MISWFPVRIVTLLTVVILTGSAIHFLDTISSSNDPQDAELLADMLAGEINLRLTAGEEIKCNITGQIGNIDGNLTLTSKFAVAKVGKSEHRTPLLFDVHLWDPENNYTWTSNDIEELDNNNTELDVEKGMTLELRNTNIDNATRLEAYIYRV